MQPPEGLLGAKASRSPSRSRGVHGDMRNSKTAYAHATPGRTSGSKSEQKCFQIQGGAWGYAEL